MDFSAWILPWLLHGQPGIAFSSTITGLLEVVFGIVLTSRNLTDQSVKSKLFKT